MRAALQVKQSVRAPPPSWQGMAQHEQSPLGRRIARGATLGAAAGTLLVCVGLIRVVIALLAGGRIGAPGARDLRLLAFYVGGFAVGGAVFGALRPLLRGTAGVYDGCMLVGVIVMLAIALGDKGSLRALDTFDWVVLPALGVLFGGAAAWGYTRSDRRGR